MALVWTASAALAQLEPIPFRYMERELFPMPRLLMKSKKFKAPI